MVSCILFSFVRLIAVVLDLRKYRHPTLGGALCVRIHGQPSRFSRLSVFCSAETFPRQTSPPSTMPQTVEAWCTPDAHSAVLPMRRALAPRFTIFRTPWVCAWLPSATCVRIACTSCIQGGCRRVIQLQCVVALPGDCSPSLAHWTRRGSLSCCFGVFCFLLLFFCFANSMRIRAFFIFVQQRTPPVKPCSACFVSRGVSSLRGIGGWPRESGPPTKAHAELNCWCLLVSLAVVIWLLFLCSGRRRR